MTQNKEQTSQEMGKKKVVQVLVKSPKYGEFYVSTEFVDFKSQRVTRTFRTVYF